ncbi:MAG TPA: GNAT family N-acetyltransferase [Thermodesulfobium narugense]|uniref:Ribosomal-protein-alanine N-acetyltransferase n=1 Tax=Thermodesulfobium acidiphilum TaxID=1794699 RepID=A0A2R4VYQ9_THEAF|nr:GNAT family N-acetyltransferase [Thermodesulfobium acidiphilum]AWB09652.1 ribosomal-protein-alanine N-acetyltransferase [Thermodesulfobium acidiphilum]PMP85522.1 MAG: ribosomal-protein-alanine N-acetyltransferase [Thermodesulfobium narugense]HEM55226.1 GNAT family N-acetyltransferase [Thermodesulfobium narugense]
MEIKNANSFKIGPSKFDIIPATLSHCESLMEFGKDLPSFYSNIEFLKKDLSDPLKCFFIAIYKDLVVGFISFFKLYDEIHLAYIYVKKDFRNMGLGTRLFKFAYEKFFLKGKEIWLEVETSNTTACLFYTKLGFRIVYRRKNYYGENKDAWIMKREA